MKRRLASGEVLDAAELEALARVPAAPVAPPVRPLAARPRAPVAPPSPRAGRTDLELLEALAAVPERLSSNERRAFKNMLERFQLGAVKALSFAQRAWAQEAAARAGLGELAVDDWRETAAELRRR